MCDTIKFTENDVAVWQYVKAEAIRKEGTIFNCLAC